LLGILAERLKVLRRNLKPDKRRNGIDEPRKHVIKINPDLNGAPKPTAQKRKTLRFG
jgi:hypothetical protein